MSHLAQCLKYVPAQDLRKIAGRFFSGNTASSGRAADITRLMVEKLLDEHFLAGFLGRLDDWEMAVLSLLVWAGNRESMDKREVEALLRSVGNDHPAESVASLAGKGIVFESGYGSWSNVFVPKDLAGKVAAVWARTYLPPAVSGDLSGNIFEGGLYEDCLTFLAYVHKNGVRLTQKNALPKRTVAKIFSIMKFKESTADIPPDYFYTLRFFLLLNYCSFIKAVTYQGRAVTVHTAQLKQWLKEEPLPKISKAAPYLWSILLKACPNPITEVTLKLVQQMQGSQWYSYTELAGAARRLLAPFGCEGPQPEYFLDVLLDAGLLLEGLSRDGEKLVRSGFGFPGNPVSGFPPLPGEEEGFWVQPNLEVLVPPRLAPELRWQLEMMAQPVKADQAFTYALTREAACAFFDRGGTVDQMIGFLEKHTRAPLSQNVLFTIRDWGALHGRVSFWDVFLLRCDEARLADEIAAHPKLKRFVQGRFDLNHLVVPRDEYAALLAALQKTGYFPKKGISRG